MYPTYNASAYGKGVFGSTTEEPLLTSWTGRFVFDDTEGSFEYPVGDAPASPYPPPLETNLLEATMLIPEPVPEADLRINYNVVFHEDDYGVNRAYQNGETFDARVLDASRPVLFDYLEGGGDLEEREAYPKYSVIPGDGKRPFVLPFNRTIDVYINNTDGGEHPFHLHGHRFFVISTSEYESAIRGTSFPSSASISRDVVSVPAMGYAQIRFVSDNPGVWMFHCHIDWHMRAVSN